MAPIVSKPPHGDGADDLQLQSSVPDAGFCWRISFRDARLFHERTAAASAGPRRPELLNPIADYANSLVRRPRLH